VGYLKGNWRFYIKDFISENIVFQIFNSWVQCMNQRFLS